MTPKVQLVFSLVVDPEQCADHNNSTHSGMLGGTIASQPYLLPCWPLPRNHYGYNKQQQVNSCSHTPNVLRPKLLYCNCSIVQHAAQWHVQRILQVVVTFRKASAPESDHETHWTLNTLTAAVQRLCSAQPFLLKSAQLCSTMGWKLLRHLLIVIASTTTSSVSCWSVCLWLSHIATWQPESYTVIRARTFSLRHHHHIKQSMPQAASAKGGNSWKPSGHVAGHWHESMPFLRGDFGPTKLSTPAPACSALQTKLQQSNDSLHKHLTIHMCTETRVTDVNKRP